MEDAVSPIAPSSGSGLCPLQGGHCLAAEATPCCPLSMLSSLPIPCLLPDLDARHVL